MATTNPYHPGRFSVFQYEGHKVSVILTDEFVIRYGQRKPKPERTEWLLTEGIKEPLDTLIAMPGTRSLSAVLKAQKTKINLVLVLSRSSGEPPRIKIVVRTVHVGIFFARDIKDYVYTMAGAKKGMHVVFERDYEPDLMQAVIEDLSKVYKTLQDGAGYHLGDDIVDYIAEREGTEIRIADARWAQEFYVYEFPV